MKSAIKIALIATATVATAGAVYYGNKVLQARKAAAAAKEAMVPHEFLVQLKNILEDKDLTEMDRETYSALYRQLSVALAEAKDGLVHELVVDLKLLMALVK